jgi:hypothetical protein
VRVIGHGIVDDDFEAYHRADIAERFGDLAVAQNQSRGLEGNGSDEDTLVPPHGMPVRRRADCAV